jgi:DNA-binding MarR family transcriptional regulator
MASPFRRPTVSSREPAFNQGGRVVIDIYIGLRCNQASSTETTVRVGKSAQDAANRKPGRLSQADYEKLSEFRYLIRCFLEFSQNAARVAGLTPHQHQALLAIKGFAGGRPITIGDLAERLKIRHHSAAELVDRLSEAGLVIRRSDASDLRRVLLSLTDAAEARLADLSRAHLDELSRMKPLLDLRWVKEAARATQTLASSVPLQGREESRVRLGATRLGWRVEKSRARNLGRDNHGLYRLIDDRNKVIGGTNFSASLEDIEYWIESEKSRRSA